MTLKKYLLLILLIPYFGFSQFDEVVPKIELYNNAVDLSVYIQMIAKDKLFIINNLKKDYAKKQLDFALATVNEGLSEIELNETNPKILGKLEKVKEFWQIFNIKAGEDISLKEYTGLYFQINTFDRLISDLVESMIVNYDLPTDKLQNYNDIQKLRKYIQAVSVSYYANNLGLSKNFLHENKKNIEVIDKFIKEKSNAFLNDPIIGKYFPDFILDWNFLRANLIHPTLKNSKTVFSMSMSIDFHLQEVTTKYINKISQQY